MRNKFMINKKFDRIKKTFAVLLVLCFVLSITVASASAANKSKDKDANSKDKDAFSDGYKKGIDDGRKQGKKDCEQYDSRETLSKIPPPSSDRRWSDHYKDSFNAGYTLGYTAGYHETRYKCLKIKNKSFEYQNT
jgi:flagellar biosynthesis/type III secretory pathway protein FliH